jgi:hypothetical protein
MKDAKRAYFTYPVAGGLLEVVTVFAAAARDAGLAAWEAAGLPIVLEASQ